MALADGQLMLPLKELVTNPEYLHAFRLASESGNYIILDNGAAEGVETPWRDLLEQAETYNVDEIVLPDVLGDAEETLRRIKDVLFGAPRQFRYMAVAQGGDGREVREMIEYLCTLGNIDTIGIPRHLVGTNPHARVELVDWMRIQGLSSIREIHLLGMHPSFPAELDLFRQEKLCGYIRTVDTSMPFVAALNNRNLWQDHSPLSSRPDDYFKVHLTADQARLATWNFNYLKGESLG